LYSSPDVIRIIKSRRTRCVEHVARMEETRNAYTVLVGKPKGRGHLADLSIDGWVILKCIFNRLSSLSVR